MHVLTQKHLKEAASRFPAAAKQIAAWQSIAKDKHWHSPAEVKDTFKDVDCVDECVVFRIHQDKYRLIATIHYAHENNGALADGHIWVRSFLSNKQYDDPANWDKGVIR